MTLSNKNGSGTMPVDKKRAAQALADRALAAQRKVDALALARKALELDGECTDAQVVRAREEAGPSKAQIAQLKIIVDRAEARLGTPFLREHRGDLWEIEEARPYLRARMALASLYERSGRAALAVPHLESVLAFDAEDHLGARHRLVCCLLAAGDLKALAEFLKKREGEGSVFMAWAALLARIREGAGKSAEQALLDARRANPYFEEFLTGRRRLPRELPGNPEPGSPEEAAAALKLFGDTWGNDREGMYWLFKHG